MYSTSSQKELDYSSAYRVARHRVIGRQLFYAHFVVYLLISLLMVGIYQLSTPGGYPWFIWPIGGWGLGVLIHFFITRSIGKPGIVSHNQVEAEMERMGYK